MARAGCSACSRSQATPPTPARESRESQFAEGELGLSAAQAEALHRLHGNATEARVRSDVSLARPRDGPTDLLMVALECKIFKRDVLVFYKRWHS